jgi:SAM-dependent methyltransferase
MGNGPTTYQASSGRTARDIAAASAPPLTSVPADSSDPLTERSVRTWSAGDFERIARGYRGEAEAFIERLALAPGQPVLDVACGSGNLTIPAARTGARVSGFDLIPELLAVAKARAASEGLEIAFDRGSAEELPYADASFDVVTSMFGVMFAARPELAAAELARVTRRGGWLALATWPRDGFIGEMLALHVAWMATPPAPPSPLLWGDEAVIRERLSPGFREVSVTRRPLMFDFPYSPAGTAELFCSAYGPTVRLVESLDPERRKQFSNELAAHWSSRQRGSGERTIVDAEYVQVVATRK